MLRNFIFFTAIVPVIFSSCKKGEPTEPAQEQKVPYATLTTATNYFQTFKGSDNQTSVDFSGQTTRVNMLKEITAYMRTGLTVKLDNTKLRNMYENKGNAFSDRNLNSALDKTIISKTAQSFLATDADMERQRFNGYLDILASISEMNNQQASAGVAGVLEKKYLVNEKGWVLNQLVQKGLIGAMMVDQICNIYLGTEKQGLDNSTIVSGKNYTQLEHSWDEAYGYMTQNEYFPKKDPNDATKWLESYLGGYIRQVVAPYGNPSDVYMAFLKGRAAIVNNDANTRNEQIKFIRTELEKAIATIAISYLNKTKSATTDGSRFNYLSEGIGFIYSLRFAYNPKIDKAKSDQFMAALMNKENGFWSLTNADIDQVRNAIADTFGLDKNALVVE